MKEFDHGPRFPLGINRPSLFQREGGRNQLDRRSTPMKAVVKNEPKYTEANRQGCIASCTNWIHQPPPRRPLVAFRKTKPFGAAAEFWVTNYIWVTPETSGHFSDVGLLTERKEWALPFS